MPHNTTPCMTMSAGTHDPIKCLVVGDGGVGKTGLIIRYLGADFEERRPAAILDSVTVAAFVGPSVMEMEIMDTACQGKYDRLRHLYYPGTEVFLVCCSTNCSDSLESARTYWVPTLRKAVPNAKIVLVGTKVDTRGRLNAICETENENEDEDENQNEADSTTTTTTDAQTTSVLPFSCKTGLQVSREVGAHAYVECSALTGSGLKEVFSTAILSVVDPVTGRRRQRPTRDIGQTQSLPIQ